MNPTSYWFTVDELDNAAAAELQPADPNIHPEAPAETEEQKRDRLWRAVVDAAQGNG